ncbi:MULTISPECIES: cysteine synthase A [Slackia]|uniref:cysteine synthase A n=1 Tax=Slackia TaxID=84108 RepID=UPI0029425630|nr:MULTISPECIES: cysteine synthase A [Slackia]MEE0519732.1 cysteine synthase A [Slackia sp.]
MTEHVSATIGATPLIKLERLSEEVGATVYVKFEASNPGGSIKDRAAMNMIDAAEARGEIAPGRSVLVEPTSGNTGIGIAMIGAARGYDVVLTMPESMSKERRMLLAAYGAKLVLTPAAEGMAGAVAEAERIERETPGAWIVGQFTNPDNPAAHEKTTGPEIKKALGGVNPDYVVAAAGTGGTISGVAHFFNGHGKFRPGGLVDLVGERVRIYAVEPDESPLISQSLAGEELTPAPHGIQGIGANFVPETLDLDVLDGALRVTTEEAYEQARYMANVEALLVGISSGANIAGVRKLIEQHPEAKGSTIVTFAVDTGERYLSTPLFE